MSDIRTAPHGFRRYLCGNCGNPIDVPVHCSSKACEACTGVRRWRIRERLQYALQGLEPHQGHSWRHIVLTVKNSYDLQDRLDHLIKSFRNLRHRKVWKQTQSGGFYVIEITEGKDGWHPHLHVLSYGLFIPWRKLLASWRQVTGDSRHIRVTSVKNGTNIAFYISKYITKAHTLSADSIKQVDSVCRNRRLFGPFGKAAELLKRYKPPDKFAVCVKCGSKDWVPDFLIDIWNRRLTKFG